eukprot:4681421-Pyramimonas_sp.AAC.1
MPPLDARVANVKAMGLGSRGSSLKWTDVAAKFDAILESAVDSSRAVDNLFASPLSRFSSAMPVADLPKASGTDIHRMPEGLAMEALQWAKACNNLIILAVKEYKESSPGASIVVEIKGDVFGSTCYFVSMVYKYTLQLREIVRTPGQLSLIDADYGDGIAASAPLLHALAEPRVRFP